MNNEIYSGIGQSFQGFYKVKIVDATTNEVTWESDWKKNLILNQGMDALYSQNIADLTKVAVAGYGTRPNSISGETSEITQSGTHAFLNVRTGLANFTSSTSTYASTVQVGDIIKYANNSESMVSTVTDGFNLILSTNYTMPAGQTFVVWKTSQIGLESEVKRAGGGITNTNYATGTGNCGTTTVSNARTWRRSYDFVSESIDTTYTEFGIAWATSLATTVFSRILAAPPIIINAGFKLRIVYDLVGTFTPATEIYTTASIGGWPVSPSTNIIGSESLQNFLTSTVDTSGNTDATTGMLDPAFLSSGTSHLTIFASPSSASLSAFGSSVNRSTNAGRSIIDMTKAAYVNNSYYVDKSGILPIDQANRTDLRSIGMGRYVSPSSFAPEASNVVIAFLFNQTQSKNSSQTLSLTYRSSWSRTLA